MIIISSHKSPSLKSAHKTKYIFFSKEARATTQNQYSHFIFGAFRACAKNIQKRNIFKQNLRVNGQEMMLMFFHYSHKKLNFKRFFMQN